MKNISSIISTTTFLSEEDGKTLPAENDVAKHDNTAKGGRVTKPKTNSSEILKRKTEAALARLAKPLQQELSFGISQWTNDRRGVPNNLVRGGLFGTNNSGKRGTLKSKTIASLSNANIVYSGEELRQDDLSVWMSILTKAKNQTLGAPIQFTGYELIKDMRWRMHTESYEKLRECIERLKLTSVKLTSKDEKAAYAGSLIRDYTFDAISEDGKPKWQVRLEPNIVSLFIESNTTLVEWEQRKEIGTRATLTLWLHTFYSTHREPIPYRVEKLHELCRSEQKHISNFITRLRMALERLIAIGFLSSYFIEKNMLYVTRAKHQA